MVEHSREQADEHDADYDACDEDCGNADDVDDDVGVGVGVGGGGLAHEGDADGEEEGHQDHYQPLRPLTRLHLRLLLQGEKNTVMPLCELKTKHKKCGKDCGKIMIREKNLSW